jgi:hypothetical protein
MTMVLAGSYQDVRQFIHQLETAPEFVVIEDVALVQGEERTAPLVLTLQMATYYWTGTEEGQTGRAHDRPVGADRSAARTADAPAATPRGSGS